MKQALLIIDVQNDYFPNGKMELHQSEEALKQINKLEDKFNQASQPIIYIQHIKEAETADFFARGSEGAELHKGLKGGRNSFVIEKHFPNSFLETDLLETLQNLGIEQLVIAGMMTHMCVDSTTRAARELGFNLILLADATATRKLTFAGKEVEAEQVQMSFMAALQNFAEVMETEQFLGE